MTIEAIKTRNWLIYAVLALLLLAGCAPGGRATPTPTIIPLNRSVEGLDQPEQPVTPTPAPPTLTPIPFPSATPTHTPFPPAATPAAATMAATPTARPSAAVRVEVVSYGLNLRQGPGLNYDIMGTARAGDQFEVVGRPASGAWLQVMTPAGGYGWISGKPAYTRLLGSLDNVPVVPAPAAPTPAAPSVAPQGNSQPAAGGRLIFTTGSGGELYSVNADGSNLRRLAGGVIDPVLSPNGQQVAFTRWDGARVGTLYVLNLDDGSERVVVGESRQAKSPTWSPDGQEIIFSFQHGGLVNPEEICKEYDLDDGVRMPDDVAEITKFRVGKDGVHLCYIRKEDLKWALRRVKIETGTFEDLPSDDYSFNPAWDPDNPWRVVYDGSKGLMQLDLNTGRQWPLTTDLRDTGPVFSPDGKMLALTYKQHDHWEVYTLDLETGARTRLTKPPILADPQYNSASPAWSPDGSRLAFLTDRTGQWEMWVMNADGSNQQPLFSPEIQAQLDLAYRGVNEHMLNWKS